MTSIYVLDTETTGLAGAPIDSIVEIGIARVDLNRGKVYPNFSRIINAPLTEQQKKEAWVFNNTDLTPEDCLASPYFIGDVASELNCFYSDRPFTAYNREFDFDKFLDKDPWNFRSYKLPCIMKTAGFYLRPDGSWLKAQDAYDILCPDNPAQLPEGLEQHRALSDAVCEGWILIRLCEEYPEVMELYDMYLQSYEIGVDDDDC